MKDAESLTDWLRIGLTLYCADNAPSIFPYVKIEEESQIATIFHTNHYSPFLVATSMVWERLIYYKVF
jgi:hypothetical protein